MQMHGYCKILGLLSVLVLIPFGTKSALQQRSQTKLRLTTSITRHLQWDDLVSQYYQCLADNSSNSKWSRFETGETPIKHTEGQGQDLIKVPPLNSAAATATTPSVSLPNSEHRPQTSTTKNRSSRKSKLKSQDDGSFINKPFAGLIRKLRTIFGVRRSVTGPNVIDKQHQRHKRGGHGFATRMKTLYQFAGRKIRGLTDYVIQKFLRLERIY